MIGGGDASALAEVAGEEGDEDEGADKDDDDGHGPSGGSRELTNQFRLACGLHRVGFNGSTRGLANSQLALEIYRHLT